MATDYIGALLETADDALHYGVKGMKWGVRKDLSKMAPAKRQAYLEGKEKKLISRLDDPRRISKAANRGLRQSKKQIKALNKDLKSQGVKLKKDAAARADYHAKTQAIMQNSMNEAATKAFGKSKTGLYEVRLIQNSQSGKVQAALVVKDNPKIMKQLNKIGKSYAKREKKMAHADISDGKILLDLETDDDGFIIDIEEFDEPDVEHSDLQVDYLAALLEDESDALHYGVKGMKWGVRRSSSELRSAAKKRGESKKTEAKPAESEKSSGSSSSSGTKEGQVAPPTVESSSQRYARLAQVAKDGGASTLSDTDLKFFNARTEALSKINKLNEKKPGWLAETSKKVLQQAAQRQMQAVADGVADKYVSGPLLENLKKKS